jgi:hypothetical protein
MLATIAANVEEFPPANIRVDYALCGEAWRYRPAAMYLGWPDELLGRQNGNMSEHYGTARKRRDRA